MTSGPDVVIWCQQHKGASRFESCVRAPREFRPIDSAQLDNHAGTTSQGSTSPGRHCSSSPLGKGAGIASSNKTNRLGRAAPFPHNALPETIPMAAICRSARGLPRTRSNLAAKKEAWWPVSPRCLRADAPVQGSLGLKVETQIGKRTCQVVERSRIAVSRLPLARHQVKEKETIDWGN